MCCINFQVAAVLFAIGGVALISLFSEKDKSTTVKNTPLGYVVSSGCVTWACHMGVCVSHGISHTVLMAGIFGSCVNCPGEVLIIFARINACESIKFYDLNFCGNFFGSQTQSNIFLAIQY